MGFEFQTQWKVAPAYFWAEVVVNTATKNSALVEGDGWKMTNDGGEAEFCTDPIEEDDYARLRSIFSDLQSFTELLLSLGPGEKSTSKLPGVTGLGKLTTLTPADQSLTAKPQVTMGISLQHVPAAMSELGRDRDPEPPILGRRRPQLYDLARFARHVPGSPKYQGLVALMASYVAFSSELMALSDSVKNITSLMMRTNFVIAFRDTDEYAELQAGRGLSKKGVQGLLLDDVLAVAKKGAKESKVPITESMRMVPPSMDAFIKATQTQDLDFVDFSKLRQGPTVEEWVLGIVDGVDLLSFAWNRASYAVPAMGAKSIEEVGPPDLRSGLRAQGVQVELRDLEGDLGSRRWKDWAERFLEWASNINSGGSTTLPDLSKTQRFRQSRLRWAQQMELNARLIDEAKEILANLSNL